MENSVFSFEGNEVVVHPTGDTKQWFMTVEEVAAAYTVNRVTIMRHLNEHADELREGIEKGVQIMNTLGGQQQLTILYREGVIKLGFFIRSPKAVAFRQFATNLIISVLDATNTSMEKFLARFDQMDERFDKIEDVCRGLRDEVDELRATVQIFINDTDATTIRELIKRIKIAKEIDGRAIVGHVRKMLNVGSIYETPDTKKVINILKNMIGQGLQLVDK
jgi:prophage antirepressor-like protein